MQIVDLIHSALPISLMLIVLALGLRCSWSDATFLFHEPSLFARSLLAMNVVLPIAAVLIATSVALKPPVAIALFVLAISPVPRVLPPKLLKLVTRDDYVYGLLVATALLAILLIPLSLAIISGVSGRDLYIDPILVARSVAISVLLPLGVGLLVRQFLPGFANRITGAVSMIGTLLLAVSMLAIFAIGWRGFGALIGDGTLLAFVVFTLLSLALGHMFGGPRGDERTVLALSCASRHPGVAIAIGVALFPGQKKLIAVAVLLDLIVAALASIPYTRWRKTLHERTLAGREPASPGRSPDR